MEYEKRTAFILAAGLGTRLKELTSNKPKALVSINNKTLLQVTLEYLQKQSFNHFVINIHHFGEQIIDFVKENLQDIDIEISDERQLLMDTGGAILQALSLFRDSKAVLIHNVDIISDLNLKDIYDDFCKTDDAVWLLTQQRDNKRKIVFDENENFAGRLNIETGEYNGIKPLQDFYNKLSFSGLHIIKPSFFKDLEVKPCYVFDIYGEIARKHAVKSHPVQPSYWFDLGTEQQLKNASEWFLSKK